MIRHVIQIQIIVRHRQVFFPPLLGLSLKLLALTQNFVTFFQLCCGHNVSFPSRGNSFQLTVANNPRSISSAKHCSLNQSDAKLKRVFPRFGHYAVLYLSSQLFAVELSFFFSDWPSNFTSNLMLRPLSGKRSYEFSFAQFFWRLPR